MPDVPEPGFSAAVTVPSTDAGHDGPPRCGGQLRQPSEAHDGDTCTQAAGWGTDHPGVGRCKLHGGSTPSHIASAERVKAEQALLRAQQTFGLPVDVEPGEALLDRVRRLAGVVAWLEAQIGALPVEQLTVEGRAHPLVGMYLDFSKQIAQVAKAALDAGIAERRVRLEEAQGQLLVGFVERLLRRLGHDPMDPAVRDAVREELMAIEGGQAA